ncbi:conserved hypothetical protein [Parafrankia sp. EAN1pec]|uniref:hypothetical protein n=1 Tax=Parafrankia sp. (strain EAN1pec) TaxID=298653 RepID=UPI0000541FF5|nr:conserved hypothetical protein [Frankia sp. EAN1pec]
MSTPIRITAGLYSVRLRDDMPREVTTAHWAGQHADIMRKLPHIDEYIQQQFSATDHGYWPATPGVGTRVPEEFRLDGYAEIRLPSIIGGILSALHTREIMLDEQNLFRHVVGKLTGPKRGRWWPDEEGTPIPHRTAVLLRRRSGTSSRDFRRFVHDQLGPALHEAGALDLRTYTFIPSSKLTPSSPAVAHNYPVERRIHGGLVIGAEDRSAISRMLKADAVATLTERQSELLTAAHAYTIERSATVIDKTVRPGAGRRRDTSR